MTLPLGEHDSRLLRFVVPGPAVGKGRHRTGRNRATGAPQHFAPAKTVTYERLVATYGRLAYGMRAPFEGAFFIVVVAEYMPPKSWSKTKTDKAYSGLILHEVKPDGSNIGKAVEDALNKIVYCDDSAAIITLTFKRYSRMERTTVSIYDATKENAVQTLCADLLAAWGPV